MKKIFDINDYDNNCVMHCRTLDEAVEFTQYLDSIGKRWCNKERYRPTNTMWDRYGANTCYEFIGGTFCELHYFERNRYQILSFADFDFKDIYEIGENDNESFNQFIGEFMQTT